MKKIIVLVAISIISLLNAYSSDCKNNIESKIMKPEVINVINECIKLSFDDNKAFPQVVKKLLEVNIERYFVDLVRLEITYYGSNQDFYTTKLPISKCELIGDVFIEKNIRDAILEIQKAEIDYDEFLRKAMKSGLVGYINFMKGKQVHYMGAKGEFWIEHYPQDK